MAVVFASHVLEGDCADLVREVPRLRVKRLKSRVFDFEDAAHLLNEQEGVGPDVEDAMAMAQRPLERGEERAILGDVVRRGADRLRELLDQLTVGPFDSHAESGGPRVAPRAAVDVRDDRSRAGHRAGCSARSAGAA